MNQIDLCSIFANLIINQLFVWNAFGEIGQSNNMVVVLVIGVVLDIVLLIIMQKQRNKERLERELEEITAQYEYEMRYYKEMEKSRETMAKIRHDYNNHITSVLGLINMGKINDAKMMIHEMIELTETTLPK